MFVIFTLSIQLFQLRAWAVFAWEVLSRGQLPYGEAEPKIIVSRIIKGTRLECDDRWPSSFESYVIAVCLLLMLMEMIGF